VKTAFADGKLLLEVHPPVDAQGQSTDPDMQLLSERLDKALGTTTAAIHWDFARQALQAANGMPVIVGLQADLPDAPDAQSPSAVPGSATPGPTADGSTAPESTAPAATNAPAAVAPAAATSPTSGAAPAGQTRAAAPAATSNPTADAPQASGTTPAIAAAPPAQR